MSAAVRAVVWLCGRTSLTEFQPARRWLAQRYELVELPETCGTKAKPIKDAVHSLPPPLAILDVRDAFSPAANSLLSELAAQQPLALVMQFLGPWCDGLGRSPGFAPGVLRIPWHGWEVELPEYLQPRSFLPRTAMDADRILDQARRKKQPVPGPLGIVSASRETTAALIDAVGALGATAVRLEIAVDPDQISRVNFILIDLDGSRDQEAWLKPWLAVAADVPLVILTGFLRPEAKAHWETLGNIAVISKPFSLLALQAALQAVAAKPV